MRSVMGALLHQGSRGFSARIEVQPPAFLRVRLASTAWSVLRRPCVGNTVKARGAYAGNAALDWSGRTRSARRQDEQASSVLTFGQPTRPKKPIRRCFKPRPPL